jgi:hypothetical protein
MSRGGLSLIFFRGGRHLFVLLRPLAAATIYSRVLGEKHEARAENIFDRHAGARAREASTPLGRGKPPWRNMAALISASPLIAINLHQAAETLSTQTYKAGKSTDFLSTRPMV